MFRQTIPRVVLMEDEQPLVNVEREPYPEPHVRRKMLVLWSRHCGRKRARAAKLAGGGRATVERYVAAYCDGGVTGLRWGVQGPVSDLAAYRDAIPRIVRATAGEYDRRSLRADRAIDGLKRGPTQVHLFRNELGLK